MEEPAKVKTVLGVLGNPDCVEGRQMGSEPMLQPSQDSADMPVRMTFRSQVEK